MERKISTKLKEWKSNPDHKPLLITGCRQIGKTYSVLFESKSAEGPVGHAENYCEVLVDTPDLSGSIHNVIITGQKNGMLLGKLC